MVAAEATPVVGTVIANTSGGSSHYCPCCLKRVRAAEVRSRPHREVCHSGNIDVRLVECPGCGTVLAAEVVTDLAQKPVAAA